MTILARQLRGDGGVLAIAVIGSAVDAATRDRRCLQPAVPGNPCVHGERHHAGGSLGRRRRMRSSALSPCFRRRVDTFTPSWLPSRHMSGWRCRHRRGDAVSRACSVTVISYGEPQWQKHLPSVGSPTCVWFGETLRYQTRSHREIDRTYLNLGRRCSRAGGSFRH